MISGSEMVRSFYPGQFTIHLTEFEGRFRPCLVLSENRHRLYRKIVLVAPCVHPNLGGGPYGVPVDLDGKKFVIRIDLMMGVDLDCVKTFMGKLDEATRSHVQRTLAEFYGIPPTGQKEARFKFELNANVNFDEDREYEFKSISSSKGPVDRIRNTAGDYAVSFLNSDGGSIFWGITDKQIVDGVKLSLSQRDDVRKDVTNKLIKIQPVFDVSQTAISFHPIYTSGKVVAELFVVELSVPRGNPRILYFTESNEAFERLDGVKRKLKGPEIQRWIEARLEQGQRFKP
jgi:hypothetical protein